MARMLVYLDEVICHNTEDITGADEFYVIGAITTTDGQHSKAVVTRPMSINDRQTLKFGPGGGYVFDTNVADNTILQIEMIAFDEDAAKNIERYDQARQLANQALTVTPVSFGGASIALDAVRTLMQLDQDDELGTYRQPFHVWQMPQGCHFQQWNVHGGSTAFSDWNYWVRFWVCRF
ncbi:hypothetical protein H6F95_29240 [Cyanobacteria bacterium FACHB-471]|nr:hypothetical protein [Cyanobacteria bacterium FACHB-471]